jgi:hypothetical protein
MRKRFNLAAAGSCDPPALWLVGDFGAPEFGDAVGLLQETAQVARCADVRPTDSGRQDSTTPELIIFAASRPGIIRAADVASLQRRFPLSGTVALLGNWCEGETRTGRPVPGVQRVFWYDFVNWWLRQLDLRAAGRMPDWAMPATQDNWRVANIGEVVCQIEPRGLIALATTCWETGEALAAVLRSAGYSTAWHPRDRAAVTVRGAIARIWEGQMLDAVELRHLSELCQPLNREGAPVVALADFPRLDRCEAARTAGAMAVLSKPWLNVDLLATIARITTRQVQMSDDQRVAQAA